jgi:succinate dehydrogenase flavin-adding protein (antitoxin of CptAB toxin-antitoxin module)
LAEKMIAHLLDKIRTQFNIVTNKLDEEFVQQLSKKSGASMMNTSEMISKINTIRNMTSISADQLVSLYSTIQQFNQHFS